MNSENVFEISTRLKQRFCKDLSVPIQVFSEPAFTRRIKLFGYEGKTVVITGAASGMSGSGRVFGLVRICLLK